MAGFWDSMNEGFDKGVPLGVRAAERAQEDKYRQSAENRAVSQEKRASETHAVALKEANVRTQEADQRQRQDKFRTAYVVAKALAEDGKERPAAGIIGQAYNKLVNDGNEAIIIAKEDRPDDPKWAEFPEDTQYLVGSPKFGVTPYKSMKDVLKTLEPYAMDSKKYIEHEDTARREVSTRNAENATKIIFGQDGRPYIKQEKLTARGVESAFFPYVGPMPESATQGKIREAKKAEKEAGIPLDMGIVLGQKKASTEAELISARAKAAEAGTGGKPTELQKNYNFLKGLFPNLSDEEVLGKARKGDLPSEGKYVMDTMKIEQENGGRPDDVKKAGEDARTRYRSLFGGAPGGSETVDRMPPRAPVNGERPPLSSFDRGKKGSSASPAAVPPTKKPAPKKTEKNVGTESPPKKEGSLLIDTNGMVYEMVPAAAQPRNAYEKAYGVPKVKKILRKAAPYEAYQQAAAGINR